MTKAEMAWLEYQVRMGEAFDAHNLPQSEVAVLRAIFLDGYHFGYLDGSA